MHIATVISDARLDDQLRELQATLGANWQVQAKRDFAEADPATVALVVPPGTWLGEEQIDRLAAVRVVATTSVGTDHVDVAALERRGIPVVTPHGFNMREVADHTLACVLASTRDIGNGVNIVRSGGWGSLQTKARRISSTVLGLVGFGDIARLVATDALALGMHVLVCNRSPLPAAFLNLGIEQTDLATLMGRSHIVSVHLPLTAETRGLIDGAALAGAMPGVSIVNTARSGVVDETALLDGLHSGIVSQAWLDVLPTEPPDENDPLLHLDNVFVTPHMAWLSPQSRVAGYRIVGERIERLIRDSER